MGFERVSAVLWQERELLELLAFKLAEQSLLAGANTRWLPHATREVDRVLERIREAELLRAVVVDEAAAGVGLAPGASLRALAEAAPPQWASLLAEHRDAFLVLINEITTNAEANRTVLATGQRSAQETLLGLDGLVETYDPRGRASAPAAAHLLDRAL